MLNAINFLGSGLQFIAAWFSVCFSGFLVIWYIADLFMNKFVKLLTIVHKRLAITESHVVKCRNTILDIDDVIFLQNPDRIKLIRLSDNLSKLKEGWVKHVYKAKFDIFRLRLYKVVYLALATYLFYLNATTPNLIVLSKAFLLIIMAIAVDWRKLFMIYYDPDNSNDDLYLYNNFLELTNIVAMVMCIVEIVSVPPTIGLYKITSLVYAAGIIISVMEVIRVTHCEGIYKRAILRYVYTGTRLVIKDYESCIAEGLYLARYDELHKKFCIDNKLEVITDINKSMITKEKIGVDKVTYSSDYLEFLIIEMLFGLRKYGEYTKDPYYIQNYGVAFTERLDKIIETAKYRTDAFKASNE